MQMYEQFELYIDLPKSPIIMPSSWPLQKSKHDANAFDFLTRLPSHHDASTNMASWHHGIFYIWLCGCVDAVVLPSKQTTSNYMNQSKN